MLNKKLENIFNEIITFANYDYDFEKYNLFLTESISKFINEYGYDNFVDTFNKLYGIDYKKIELAIVNLKKKSNDKINNYQLKEYLAAIIEACKNIKGIGKCNVIDTYLNNTTVIFLIYYYYYKNHIYHDYNTPMTFYKDYINADKDKLHLVINSVFELTRCRANVNILRDIIFGNLRDDVNNRFPTGNLTRVLNLNEYIDIVTKRTDHKIYLEIDFISPVFNHIFSIIRFPANKNSDIKFQIIQSYFYKYSPITYYQTESEFKKMMIDIHSFFYYNEQIPHEKKYGFLDQNDIDIWKKYFYGDISKYVNRFSKLYCWYDSKNLSKLIINLFRFIALTKKNFVYKKLNIPSDEWVKIVDTVEFIYGNTGSLYKFIVDIKFTIDCDSKIQKYIRYIYKSCFKIAKSMLTDKAFIKTSYEYANKSYSLPYKIYNLVNKLASKTESNSKINMKYRQIPDNICYQNLEILVNYAKKKSATFNR